MSRRSLAEAGVYSFPFNGPPPRPPPIRTVDQFRPATFQMPHITPEEFCRLAQDIAPDLINQPSPSISRRTIAEHGQPEFQMPVQDPYESDRHFDLRILYEKRRFQKEMVRRVPSLLSGTARIGSYEQSTWFGVMSVGW
jgi:hypothetical protein